MPISFGCSELPEAVPRTEDLPGRGNRPMAGSGTLPENGCRPVPVTGGYGTRGGICAGPEDEGCVPFGLYVCSDFTAVPSES